MRTYDARLTEIHLAAGEGAADRLTAWIDCPPSAVPAVGQYVLAYAPEDPVSVTATALFRGMPRISHSQLGVDSWLLRRFQQPGRLARP